MPIDLTKIPNTRRLRLIRLGLQFGSQDTLDQANQTLAAYKAYAATLKTSGFGAKQAQELTDARDGLLAAGVGRQAAKGKKKATGEAYVAAFKQASGARIHARTVLAAVREDLEANGGEDAAVQVLSTAIPRSSRHSSSTNCIDRKVVRWRRDSLNPGTSGSCSLGKYSTDSILRSPERSSRSLSRPHKRWGWPAKMRRKTKLFLRSANRMGMVLHARSMMAANDAPG